MDHWVWRRNCTVSNAGGHLDLAIGGNLGGAVAPQMERRAFSRHYTIRGRRRIGMAVFCNVRGEVPVAPNEAI